MKKIIGILATIALIVSCKVEKGYQVIFIEPDNNFCIYTVYQDSSLLAIKDSCGKYEIGDYIKFNPNQIK